MQYGAWAMCPPWHLFPEVLERWAGRGQGGKGWGGPIAQAQCRTSSSTM